MPVRKTFPVDRSDGTRIHVKVWTEDIEQSAEEQLKNVAMLPFVSHLVAMPDVHAGIGATIGSVITTSGAICPAAVGVDIGCGMQAIKTKLIPDQVMEKAKTIRDLIESRIPVGTRRYEEVAPEAVKWWSKRGSADLINRIDPNQESSLSLGTLGGGNHFIEICLDQANAVWIMLHSGSRGIGNRVANWHIENARNFMRKMFVPLKDIDLAYLVEGTDEFESYITDMKWCQDYALKNREVMMERVLRTLSKLLHFDGSEDYSWFANIDDVIDCHHNYIDQEEHYEAEYYVTRKGAISAKDGEMGIIPGSMGTKSYIVRGLGNEKSLASAPHGAGRRMSRIQAKNSFSVEDMIKQTEGVECKKDKSVLDEIPGAYKNIEEVMYNSSDLVEIYAILKQVICVKG